MDCDRDLSSGTRLVIGLFVVRTRSLSILAIYRFFSSLVIMFAYVYPIYSISCSALVSFGSLIVAVELRAKPASTD